MEKHKPVQCEGCTEYDNENYKCTRIGQCADNKGTKGVCWMERSEGEY